MQRTLCGLAILGTIGLGVSGHPGRQRSAARPGKEGLSSSPMSRSGAQAKERTKRQISSGFATDLRLAPYTQSEYSASVGPAAFTRRKREFSVIDGSGPPWLTGGHVVGESRTTPKNCRKGELKAARAKRRQGDFIVVPETNPAWSVSSPDHYAVMSFSPTGYLE